EKRENAFLYDVLSVFIKTNQYTQIYAQTKFVSIFIIQNTHLFLYRRMANFVDKIFKKPARTPYSLGTGMNCTP
ncbi:MAG: hypothetical protein KAI72_09765, partial [Candidatus Pacebacteria bacterium]|nr:hypothetical protein [Candidatus Paceibacterota bacterium]